MGKAPDGVRILDFTHVQSTPQARPRDARPERDGVVPAQAGTHRLQDAADRSSGSSRMH